MCANEKMIAVTNSAGVAPILRVKAPCTSPRKKSSSTSGAPVTGNTIRRHGGYLPGDELSRERGTMQVVHMGLWKVKPDADRAMLQSAAEKVARFKEIVPGCLESLLAPLYVPEMGQADQETFGSLGSFEEMARGYNYILYTVFESEDARRVYEEHPIHMDLQEECLAVWVGDAAASALVFDFRRP
jgi:Stress responsive A/B Barrel Domain